MRRCPHSLSSCSRVPLYQHFPPPSIHHRPTHTVNISGVPALCAVGRYGGSESLASHLHHRNPQPWANNTDQASASRPARWRQGTGRGLGPRDTTVNKPDVAGPQELSSGVPCRSALWSTLLELPALCRAFSLAADLDASLSSPTPGGPSTGPGPTDSQKVDTGASPLPGSVRIAKQILKRHDHQNYLVRCSKSI